MTLALCLASYGGIDGTWVCFACTDLPSGVIYHGDGGDGGDGGDY